MLAICLLKNTINTYIPPTHTQVPNLFSPKEDYAQIRDKVKKDYLKLHNLEKDARIADDELIDFFFTRV
jgi:dynein heavy chain